MGLSIEKAAEEGREGGDLEILSERLGITRIVTN
jgi:hypothetical protein